MKHNPVVRAVKEREDSKISLPALCQEVEFDPETVIDIIESTEKLEKEVVESSGKFYHEIRLVDDQEASEGGGTQ